MDSTKFLVKYFVFVLRNRVLLVGLKNGSIRKRLYVIENRMFPDNKYEFGVEARVALQLL